MVALRIVRLLRIVDTRQREERDGMFSSYSVPIPGTGIEHECARCGALHEVHAHVELEGGATAVVGTGCARQAAMDAGDDALARAVSTAERRMKARAQALVEIAALRRVAAERDAAEAEILALPAPPVEWHPEGDRRWSLTCGDAKVWSPAGPDALYEERPQYRAARVAEREECAVRAWREERHRERGTGGVGHRQAHFALADALKRLAKLDEASR